LKLKEKQLRLVERERKLQENYQDAQRQQAQKRQGFLDDTGSNRGSLTSGSNFTNSSMFGNNNNGRRRF
jgi:hypothetical protein